MGQKTSGFRIYSRRADKNKAGREYCVSVLSTYLKEWCEIVSQQRGLLFCWQYGRFFFLFPLFAEGKISGWRWYATEFQQMSRSKQSLTTTCKTITTPDEACYFSHIKSNWTWNPTKLEFCSKLFWANATFPSRIPYHVWNKWPSVSSSEMLTHSQPSNYVWLHCASGHVAKISQLRQIKCHVIIFIFHFFIFH